MEHAAIVGISAIAMMAIASILGQPVSYFLSSAFFVYIGVDDLSRDSQPSLEPQIRPSWRICYLISEAYPKAVGTITKKENVGYQTSRRQYAAHASLTPDETTNHCTTVASLVLNVLAGIHSYV